MLNDHITDELDRFRQAPGRAFYALQIDAPWGAGKTYFIRSYLERTCGPRPAPGRTSDEPRYLLISLFGATSAADLERQMVAQLFSVGERSLGRLASLLAGGAAAFFRFGPNIQTEVDRQGPQLVSERLKRLRDLGGLIVFDDVERTRMSLRDTLGYINRFVEYEGFKVVLVSNEAALKQETASQEDTQNLADLRRFKEKLVGRTLALLPNPDGAFAAFVDQMGDRNARRLALQDREAAVVLFHASERNNLRSLRMGLEAFDRLVPHFEEAWLEQPKAMREILLGCLYIALEHAGGVDSEVLATPPHKLALGALGLGRREGKLTPAAFEAKRILTLYQGHLSLDGPPIPFSAIIKLVADGRLEVENLRKSMAESPLVVGEAQAPPWRTLIEVWNLDVEGSRRAVARAKQQFDQLAVTDPGELLHLAGIMLWRADHGDLSLSDGQPVPDFMEAYLNRLQERGIALGANLEPLDRQPHLSAYGYVVTGAGTGDEDDPADLQRIAMLIREASLGGIRRRFPEFREHLLAELAKPDRDLSTIGTKGDLRLALDLPIFEGWEAGPFADLLLRDGGFDRRALSWLAGRYADGRQRETLTGEAGWFEVLREELRSRIARIDPPFRSSWRQDLDHVADPTLDKLRRRKFGGGDEEATEG